MDVIINNSETSTKTRENIAELTQQGHKIKRCLPKKISLNKVIEDPNFL